MVPRLPAVIAGIVVTSLPALAPPAWADSSKQACIDGNAHAQIDERAGRLREAHEQLVSCASDACPPLVRADCARLLTEVSERQPTVVVNAHDAAGAETTEVRLSVDGVIVAEALGGLEIEIDPGPHRLRFEAKSSGQVKEQQLVLQEGEKRRRVSVDFERGASARPAPVTSAGPRAAPPAAHPWVVPVVLGGVGAAAAVTFGIFATAGYTKEKSLAGSCAPFCNRADADSVKTDYLVGDIALGVALVSLGAAVLVAWLARGRPPTTPAWGLGIAPARGGTDISGRIGW